MSKNSHRIDDALKSYAAGDGAPLSAATLNYIMGSACTGPSRSETPPVTLWREGNYSLETIETIFQLTEHLTCTEIDNTTMNDMLGVYDHPTALLYFASHRFFRFVCGESTYAIIIVDYLRCLCVSTYSALRPDNPHLPAICKAIAAIKAIPSPSPQNEIHHVVGLPHSPFANTALLDDGRYVPIANAPVGQILRARVNALDLPADAVYALLASPNINVHIGGVPQSFLDNLPTHITAALVIGNPSTPVIERVQSLGGLFLQEDAQADFPNLTSLDYLVYEGEPAIVSLPGVTRLDTFLNRDHVDSLSLPNIRYIGKLNCSADAIRFADLAVVRDAALRGRRIHLPVLCTADIIAIHDCPTVVLPNLVGVENLSLPDTKVLIAPCLTRVGWWNDYKIDTVVCGPDYKHLAFQKADHHVIG